MAVNAAAQDLGLRANDLVKPMGAAGQRPRGRQGRSGTGFRQGGGGYRRGIGRAARGNRPELARVADMRDRLPDPARRLIDPGRGRRLGVDVGSVRIGVAASDPDGILATPVETVARDRRKNAGKHLRRLAQLVAEFEAVEVVVGLPRTLADRSGPAAQDAIELAEQLARTHRADAGAVGRRTADHGGGAAVAAGGGRAGQGTAVDDRPGCRGRRFCRTGWTSGARPWPRRTERSGMADNWGREPEHWRGKGNPWRSAHRGAEGPERTGYARHARRRRRRSRPACLALGDFGRRRHRRGVPGIEDVARHVRHG